MIERLTLRRRTVLFVGCVLPWPILILLLRPADDAVTILAWPLTVAVLIVALTLELAGSPTLPLDESGCWAVMTAALYSILPMLVATVLRGQFTPLNDSRLFSLQPTPSFFARVAWYHVLYLAALSTGYLVARQPAERSVASPPSLSRRTATAVILCFVVSKAMAIVFRPEAGDGGYAGTYLAVQQLPLAARQALRLVAGVQLVLGLGVLVWAFGDWTRRRRLVFLVLLLLGVLTVTRAGERSTLAYGIIGCLVLRHRYVKPFSVSQFLTIGVVGIVLFTALGVYRSYAGLEDRAGFTLVPGAGEFEIVFANAVDLADRREFGGYVAPPVGVHVADLVSAIPSQVLPFEKWDVSDWYISTYYPALKEQGGGLAFGAVAESLLGFGPLELAVRGFGLGLIFVAIDRWARERRHRLWPVISQLWVLIFSYQTMRVSTLFPLGAFIQQMTTAFVIVWIVVQLFAVRDFLGAPHRLTRTLAGEGTDWQP